MYIYIFFFNLVWLVNGDNKLVLNMKIFMSQLSEQHFLFPSSFHLSYGNTENKISPLIKMNSIS